MKRLLVSLVAASAAGTAFAAPPEPQASIPFVSFKAIRTFDAVDRDTVYLQDRQRQWYRADVIGPCFDLPWAHAIGVDTHGSDTVDRYSTLIVDGQRCQLISLVQSGPPPKKVKRKKA